MQTPFYLLTCVFLAVPVAAQGIQAAPAPVSPATEIALPAHDLAGLRTAERRRAQAVASRDIATLRNLISSDYYHVDTMGRLRSKTEFLQLLARDEFEFRSYDVLDMEVRMLDNGRTAVVMGRFNADLQQGGVQREYRGRYLRIWTQGPDGWRNTMQQSTEMRSVAGQR